ncbi:MAG: hypothetical protein N2110_06845 [Flavobacteriales bacterium]|nr:hypothetical protein [Flavobacteriales bacterium]
MSLLKKDNGWMGLAIGLFLPICIFLALYFLDQTIASNRGRLYIIRDDQKFVLSVIVNILSFRLYMVTWNLYHTGKGILGATFLYAIFYVVYFELLGKSFIIKPQ